MLIILNHGYYQPCSVSTMIEHCPPLLVNNHSIDSPIINELSTAIRHSIIDDSQPVFLHRAGEPQRNRESARQAPRGLG